MTPEERVKDLKRLLSPFTELPEIYWQHVIESIREAVLDGERAESAGAYNQGYDNGRASMREEARFTADKEISRLKAELEDRDKKLGTCIAQGVGTTIDRDLWKSRAEKLAEALRSILDWTNKPFPEKSTFRTIAKAALAEWGEGK